MPPQRPDFQLDCPVPRAPEDTVLLSHGGGGRHTHSLIQRVFQPRFDNVYLRQAHDGAVLPPAAGRLAMTTDSYVVHPLFFPGGDIGRLAVYGTVNDLAMCGARPLYMSLGLILEEGLSMDCLERVATSIAEAAARAEVALVTGDTKVVDRGRGHGLYINTTGIGVVPEGVEVGPHRVRPGNCIVLSGDLGAHGVAVLSVREGMALEGAVESDAAPLHGIVAGMLEDGVQVACLRDLTRGGLAGALHEIAQAAGVSCVLEEAAIPVSEAVSGACELLGLDPLYVANEGRLVAFVAPDQAEAAVAAMRRHALSSEARVVGRVREQDVASVVLRTTLGTTRIVDWLAGEQLPRIC